MNRCRRVLLPCCLLLSVCCAAQAGFPWNNPLRIAWSTDGRTFGASEIFQDSAGVPSVVRWKGDTLIAAFQWFRAPDPSPSWDRVATKFSYDNGRHWTQPQPVVFEGLPPGYQRPFDPTLAVYGGDSIRIYFSSSNGMPKGGLDSSVNTYSARSTDGRRFIFEAGARVDQTLSQVIDPAVIYFNTGWHYLAPIGAPEQGAYHYTSPNGLRFSAVANIPSDKTHNWTGNYMVQSSSELRFYGSGPTIWYAASPNGGVWSGYIHTNIQGGDPTVLRVQDSSYLMIFVGPPYLSDVVESTATQPQLQLFPNPAHRSLSIELDGVIAELPYCIVDAVGRTMMCGNLSPGNSSLQLNDLPRGVYLLRYGTQGAQMFCLVGD